MPLLGLNKNYDNSDLYWFDNSPDNKVDQNNTQRSFGDYVNDIEQKNRLKEEAKVQLLTQEISPSLDRTIEKSQLRYSNDNSRVKSEEGKAGAQNHHIPNADQSKWIEEEVIPDDQNQIKQLLSPFRDKSELNKYQYEKQKEVERSIEIVEQMMVDNFH